MKSRFLQTAARLSKEPKILSKPKVFTRNTSGINLIKTLSFLLLLAGILIIDPGQKIAGMTGILHAEDQPIYSSIPEFQVNESSKPVFDPELFKDKPPQVDPFIKDLREDMDKFSRKQLKRRKKFLEKVRKKEMESEVRQDKIIAFNRKEREKLEKFHEKQRKKIKKYHGEKESL